MNSSLPTIDFRGVSFHLEDRFQVFDNMTLAVGEGERCVIGCESGSGTSFFGRLALGLFRPRSGSIRVLGVEVSVVPLDELMALRRRVGFVFRDSRLIGNLDVEHNIALPLNYHRLLSPEQVDDRVEELMSILRLVPFRRQRPAGLTAEQRMRTAIGRSMAVAPEVLLYDNPLAGFSGHVAEGLLADVSRLMKWTAEARPGGRLPTLLCAATETREFESFADRIGTFEDGRVTIEPVSDPPVEAGD